MAQPVVLLCYAHDSRARQDRVFDLANRLRRDGIDARLDQFEEMEPEDWTGWIESQADAADFILLVASPRVFNQDLIFQNFSGSQEGPEPPEPIRWVNDAPAIHAMIYQLRGSPEHLAIDPDTHRRGSDRFLSEPHAGCIERFIQVALEAADRACFLEPAGSLSRYDLESAAGYDDLLARLRGETQGQIAAPLPARPRATDFFRPWFAPYRKPPTGDSRPEARELHRILEERGVAAISGPAGWGKSHLALEYAWAFRDAYCALFWIRSDSTRAIQASWKRIAAALAIRPDAVPAWLRANPGWLIVYDDADRFDLSPVRENGHVLFAVRAGSAPPGIEGVTLPPREVPGAAEIQGAMKAREASNLLSLLAFFDPQNIGRDLIEHATLPEDRQRLPALIERLSAAGLLRNDLLSGGVSVPRVVQEAIRAQMPVEARAVWSARALRIFRARLADARDPVEILPHVLACTAVQAREDLPSLEAADLLERIARIRPLPLPPWRRSEPAQPWIEADHPGMLESLLRQALATRRRLLDPNHPEIADLLELLGLRCFETARYQEAANLYRQALRIREAHPRSLRLDVAASIQELAMCADESGQWEESERLWRHAAVMSRMAGAVPQTAACLRRLAKLYRSRADSLASAGSA